MKTVITSTGNTLDSKLDLRFGRAAYFCVYDNNSETTEFVRNDYAQAQGGAGTKTSEKMIELGVNKIISGDFGPKAKELLDKFNIQLVLLTDDSKSVKDIIELMKNK